MEVARADAVFFTVKLIIWNFGMPGDVDRAVPNTAGDGAHLGGGPDDTGNLLERVDGASVDGGKARFGSLGIGVVEMDGNDVFAISRPALTPIEIEDV